MGTDLINSNLDTDSLMVVSKNGTRANACVIMPVGSGRCCKYKLENPSNIQLLIINTLGYRRIGSNT